MNNYLRGYEVLSVLSFLIFFNIGRKNCLKRKNTENAPQSKPLVLETLFIAVMPNTVFIYNI